MVIAIAGVCVQLDPAGRVGARGARLGRPDRRARARGGGVRRRRDRVGRARPAAPGELRSSEFGRLAAAAATPIDDVRGSAAYRRHVVEVLARRELAWVVGDWRAGMLIRTTVNGAERALDVSPGDEPAHAPPRRARAHRLEERLRAGRVRLLQRLARRRARLLVPRARDAGGRLRRAHGRVARRRASDLHPIQTAFVEGAAIQCGFCTPGICPLGRPAGGEPPPQRPAEPRRDRRQPLPLHRLPEDHRRGAALAEEAIA